MANGKLLKKQEYENIRQLLLQNTSFSYGRIAKIVGRSQSTVRRIAKFNVDTLEEHLKQKVACEI